MYDNSAWSQYPLIRMQSSYDIARTRKRESKIRVRRYQPEGAREAATRTLR